VNRKVCLTGIGKPRCVRRNISVTYGSSTSLTPKKFEPNDMYSLPHPMLNRLRIFMMFPFEDRHSS
jgi:hypothetical protein